MPLSSQRAFTLIELLIVVAIIAILAAIAVPNFLEAQVRSKVSRAQSDLRTLRTGLEAYRVDHNNYPDGTDNPSRYPADIAAFFGPLAPGYYTFRTGGDGKVAGIDFATITTPIAYMTTVPLDVFAQQLGGRVTYCYRNAKATKNAYVLTSFGPDGDALAPNGRGTTNMNPLSTAFETSNPARLGDVSERSVIHYVERTSASIVTGVETQFGSMLVALEDLTYDPTNGTVSDGDIIQFGP